MPKNILKNIHEEVQGLYDAGLIDTTTMRKFDAHCLEPTKKLSGQDVKRIRIKNRASQPVFATYLNVSTSTVKQWETDEKNPSGASLRLLQLIDNEGLAIFKSIQITVQSSPKNVPQQRVSVARRITASRKINKQEKR